MIHVWILAVFKANCVIWVFVDFVTLYYIEPIAQWFAVSGGFSAVHRSITGFCPEAGLKPGIRAPPYIWVLNLSRMYFLNLCRMRCFKLNTLALRATWNAFRANVSWSSAYCLLKSHCERLHVADVGPASYVWDRQAPYFVLWPSVFENARKDDGKCTHSTSSMLQ